MAENRFAHGASARAAADEYAPLLPHPNADAAPSGVEDEHAFASETEEDAYWAGVADGIRQVGGTVPPRLAVRAAKEQLLVQWHDDQILPGTGRGTSEAGGGGSPPASELESPLRQPRGLPPPRSGEDQGRDVLHFTPVPVAHRANGWTPQKQRAYVEALADTGVARAAAARVGMTEQSASGLRRRADARTFDRACTAALEIGGRRILSIAYERAIEGTIKRHYFHGELKAEERVYDNRLLVSLLGRIPIPAEPDPATLEVERNWDQWMDAIEQGASPPTPAPPPSEPAEATPAARAEAEAVDAQVWEDEDSWLTNAPPPPGFDLYEEFEPGHHLYQRLLTPDEEEYWEETGQDETDEAGGYDGDCFYYLGRPTFFPWGYEKSEKFGPAAKPQGEASEAREPCGESRPSPADRSA